MRGEIIQRNVLQLFVLHTHILQLLFYLVVYFQYRFGHTLEQIIIKICIIRLIELNSFSQQHNRASKLKDHKIGRSPYFYETKSGDFSRELFKALPKTIDLLRNDLPTVVLRRCLDLLYMLASRLNRTLSNPAMAMICHFYASRCPLVIN